MAGLTVLALTTRLAYWWSIRHELLRSDAGQYHELATNLAEGRGFSLVFPQLELHPTAFRPPLYPFLLSLWYRVFGTEPTAGRILSVIIGVLVVLATFAVVSRFATPAAGLVAGTLVAVFPPIIANDVLTLTEGLSLLLLLVGVHACLERRWALAGISCGLLTLTRPSAQFLVLLLVAWLVVHVGWVRAGAATALFAAVVAPWIVRNAVELDRPVLVTSNGFNMAAIYSEEAQENGEFVNPVLHPGFADMRLSQFDEGKWDAALQERGLANLRADPGLLGRVVARNALAWLELDPSLNGGAEVADGRNLTVRTWSIPMFYGLVVVGLLGLWRARSQDIALVAGAVAAYFTLASLLFVAPPRVRVPVDLVLCIGVGLFVAHRFAPRPERFTELPRKPSPAPAGGR